MLSASVLGHALVSLDEVLDVVCVVPFRIEALDPLFAVYPPVATMVTPASKSEE